MGIAGQEVTFDAKDSRRIQPVRPGTRIPNPSDHAGPAMRKQTKAIIDSVLKRYSWNSNRLEFEDQGWVTADPDSDFQLLSGDTITWASGEKYKIEEVKRIDQEGVTIIEEFLFTK